MKTKGLIKGLFGLLLGLSVTSSANAVTLVAGHSYALTGNIYAWSTNAQYTGSYSLTSPGLLSYFTYNANNTISVVMNLLQADGDKAVLRIDNVVVGGTGTALTMNAPAGVASYTHAGVTYNDIGNFFPLGNATAYTNFAIGMPGQLNTLNNTFKFWGKFFSQNGTFLGGQTDFHLSIGNDVSAQVPEPMSMSLLGMGLLGGAINRRKRVTA